jgi:2,3-bisphosphoglycerate-dependent phosphoglycerate mutase
VIGPPHNAGMTDFVFIRHGETDWNRQQRWQGHADIPLNETGLAQAARLGERLAGERADVLVSSDLSRARQTAQPLAEVWRIAPELDSGFREQSFGLLEGLDAPTIKARHPELWLHWLEHRADFAPPGGESLNQFHARVIAAVRATADRHAGRALVVVTHGGVLDMLWRTVHGLPLDGLRACEIPNTGINRLRWKKGTLDIVQWADAGHLQGLPEQPSTQAGGR